MLKYRVSLLALVLAFSLFNVGLPIVLAACPMMQGMNHGDCPMCHAMKPSSDLQIRLPASSCCKTVSIGERNTNEFTPSRNLADFQFLSSTSIAPLNLSPIVVSGTLIALGQFCSPTPPSETDIPIFVSSLII